MTARGYNYLYAWHMIVRGVKTRIGYADGNNARVIDAVGVELLVIMS